MNIAILGSTGSVGKQALEVIEKAKHLSVYSLVANRNIALVEEQARKFKPKVVGIYDEKSALELKHRLADTDIKVLGGESGVVYAASCEDVDTVLSAIVGTAGLIPTYSAVKANKKVALANKETLVTAGHLIMELAKQTDNVILPVDSEHSAIFQAIGNNEIDSVEKIYLTASGGPFRGKTKEDLATITPKDALKHPNWSMGNKISIDSATLINKGLEVIEAKWLFDIDLNKIEVVVHPQSIIHSAVEFSDGNIIAQMGPSDMRMAISYAFSYPSRFKNNFKRLDLFSQSLTFERPDYETFDGLSLCIDAIKTGGSNPAVLNAANEVCVESFLSGKISFTDISKIIGTVLSKHKTIYAPSLNEVLEVDSWARECTLGIIKG
ncbi:1-deoxy-D-xylulose-5-phosphate reductoisomerase [Proteinivorax hydrogeniformans]|uniref:1-deoxy-D-xylulose 5-phosphate reductoisomerase n=1 Tax=Proteinivorax hydrogeniformans TaxID=1826727 RepID=A0AAU8HQX1_9FIRM